MRSYLALMPLLIACEPELYEPPSDTGLAVDTGLDAASDTDGGQGGDEGGGEGGGGGGGPDPDRPVVTGADAWCYQHTTGDHRWIWVATVTATDPQGVETIQPVTTDGIATYSGGSAQSSHALVCDANGACTSSWDVDESGMDCDRASDFTLVITVLDEDAKRSAPYETVGRQGSSAEG